MDTEEELRANLSASFDKRFTLLQSLTEALEGSEHRRTSEEESYKMRIHGLVSTMASKKAKKASSEYFFVSNIQVEHPWHYHRKIQLELQAKRWSDQRYLDAGT